MTKGFHGYLSSPKNNITVFGELSKPPEVLHYLNKAQ